MVGTPAALLPPSSCRPGMLMGVVIVSTAWGRRRGEGRKKGEGVEGVEGEGGGEEGVEGGVDDIL